MRRELQLVTVALAGAVFGYFAHRLTISPATDVQPRSTGQEAEQLLAYPNDEVRMALVVRQDIPMLKGKAAAQCAHAAVGLYRQAVANSPQTLRRWLQCGQAKITLKSRDLEEMEELAAIAMSLGVPVEFIQDAGRTQVDPGTVTVLGLGPAPRALLDQVTGNLKLY